MQIIKSNSKSVTWLVFLISIVITSQQISAHCDGLDGPVVTAARRALETGNINLVLIWVQEQDESEIKAAFDHVMAVRKLGVDAQKLADMYFFETLVRIHRAGEGAPFTGLKPAGRDLGPAIPAADRAVETGSANEVMKILNDAVHSGLHKRFLHMLESKNYQPDEVKAGREFVHAYVSFIHFVEGIYKATQKTVHGHATEGKVIEIDHDEH